MVVGGRQLNLVAKEFIYPNIDVGNSIYQAILETSVVRVCVMSCFFEPLAHT
jgi:hypothetical protein